MKKTFNININGIIFNIDEDAYNKLLDYIETLKHYFGNSSESDEIVADIEARIAELFQTKVSQSKQSIGVADVDAVIATLGNPEDIAGEENENRGANASNYVDEKYDRRLYRDRDNAVLGGVCSGISAYFDLDVVIFRILFIVFLFVGGSSILVYLILWIVTPAAKTAAQKLEMQGKRVTINNIGNKIKREYQDVKSRYRDNSFANRLGSFLHEVARLTGLFFRLLGKILSILLIVISLSIIAFTIVGLYFNGFFVSEITGNDFDSLHQFLSFIFPSVNISLILFLSALILILPAIGIIYLALKLLFNLRHRLRYVALPLFIVWILACILNLILLLDIANNFKTEENIKESCSLKCSDKKTLYISLPISRKTKIEKYRINEFFCLENDTMCGLARFYVEKSESKKVELIIEKIASGKTSNEALKAAQCSKLYYYQSDTILRITPLFRVENSFWRANRMNITLRIPNNMQIVFINTPSFVLSDVYIQNYPNRYLENVVLTMTDFGLRKYFNYFGGRAL